MLRLIRKLIYTIICTLRKRKTNKFETHITIPNGVYVYIQYYCMRVSDTYLVPSGKWVVDWMDWMDWMECTFFSNKYCKYCIICTPITHDMHYI